MIEENNKEEIEFPWLIFKLCEQYYTINSRIVSGILKLPEKIVKMPHSPKHVRGVFDSRGDIIPLIELRLLFGMESLTTEYKEFSNMLEQRKQDHLHWVKELKRSVDEKGGFKLATDPHKCAFGIWYDNYETNIHSIRHLLNKINEPHIKLHKSAEEVAQCIYECENCVRNECLGKVFERLSTEYVPKIVSLLDEAKEMFQLSFREMVIILEKNGQRFGVIADEIVSVESLNEVYASEALNKFQGAKFVAGFRKSETLDKNILEIDEDILISTINGDISIAN